jgi:hypothetical protein
MSYGDALDFLRPCHRPSPFCFTNGNTFAAIARSAAGHYVAGVLQLDELTAALAEVTIEIET